MNLEVTIAVTNFNRRTFIQELTAACGLGALSRAGWASVASQTAERAASESHRGRVIKVGEGEDLHRIFADAEPGDTIVLEAGVTYLGHFVLPKKDGDQFITIQSSALGDLPPAGQRVKPEDAAHLPTLMGRNGDAVVSIVNGAHHYRFIGIEVRPGPGVNNNELIRVGSGLESSVAELPHDLIFERVYVHGDPQAGSKHGITANAIELTIRDSYISDIKRVGQETQAICGWTGAGPVHILNNYLEAAGENVMFGGAIVGIEGLVPSDIEIRHNHFYKPPSWKLGEPTYAGKLWTVKNLLELKNARRVVIDGNLFENHWAQAQSGWAFVFTPRTQNAANPWMVVEDVTFTHNLARHISGGFNILGLDDTGQGSGFGRRITIKDNLLEDVTGPPNGNLLQLLAGVDGVTFDHNTALQTGNTMMISGKPDPHCVFTNNIANYGKFGVFGNGVGVGLVAMEHYLPEAVFKANILIGGNDKLYPKGNFFPLSPGDIRFVDAKTGDYRLAPDSKYRGAATDGKDIGADVEAIALATKGVVEGNYKL